jgi:hypothetical protein
VLEDIASNLADGLLGNTREDSIPQLLKQRGADSGYTVYIDVRFP